MKTDPPSDFSGGRTNPEQVFPPKVEAGTHAMIPVEAQVGAVKLDGVFRVAKGL